MYVMMYVVIVEEVEMLELEVVSGHSDGNSCGFTTHTHLFDHHLHHSSRIPILTSSDRHYSHAQPKMSDSTSNFNVNSTNLIAGKAGTSPITAPVAQDKPSKQELKQRLRQHLQFARQSRAPKKSVKEQVSTKDGGDEVDPSSGSGRDGKGRGTETKQMSLDDMLRDLGLCDETGARDEVKRLIQSGKVKTMQDLQKVFMKMMQAKMQREREAGQTQALNQSSQKLQDILQEARTTQGALKSDVESIPVASGDVSAPASSEVAVGVELADFDESHDKVAAVLTDMSLSD